MNEIPEKLPWHQIQWDKIESSIDRFPHATLISGIVGIGKLQLATRLAMKLLCANVLSGPCGQCRGCNLFASASHLDMHVFASEELHYTLSSPMTEYSARYQESEKSSSKRKKRRTTILISQIRALIEVAVSTPRISDNKVILVAPAEAMTISASNSILKILEEPAANTYLILIAENARNLTATIASRCQIIDLSLSAERQVANWLLTQGFKSADVRKTLNARIGPLLAKQQFESEVGFELDQLTKHLLKIIASDRTIDIIPTSKLMLKLGAPKSLEHLSILLVSLSRLSWTRTNDASDKELDDLASKIAKNSIPRELHLLYDHVCFLRHEIKDGSLDQQLAVQDVLLRLSRIKPNT